MSRFAKSNRYAREMTTRARAARSRRRDTNRQLDNFLAGFLPG